MADQSNTRLRAAVGRNIMLARQGRGLTEGALAELSGITPALLEAFEQGVKRPDASQQFALAAALQCSLGHFYGQAEQGTTSPVIAFTVPGPVQQLAALAQELQSDQLQALVLFVSSVVKKKRKH